MKPKTILMTGATGFVGSSLAARFMQSGDKVIALSRNDDHGSRTRKAIRAAASGLGVRLLSHSERLEVVDFDFDFDDLGHSLSLDFLADVDEVWHVAAEMSYSRNKIYDAFGFNVAALSTLYNACLQGAPNCRRFYHASTAYTAAFENTRVSEEIHCVPSVNNTYQLTKWAGEILLQHLASESELPVTVFRPSIVAGSTETGWSSGASFGLYMFFEAQFRASKAGQESFRLHLDPEAAANIIPVDVLTERAASLSQAVEDRSHFEIVACVADSNMRLREIAGASSSVYGSTLVFGPPISRLDRVLNRSVSLNVGFANRTWEFDASNMKRVLGSAYRPFHMRAEHIVTIAEGYRCLRERRLREAADPSASGLSRVTEKTNAA